ncbi:hypothetical protein GCM10011487_19530 [Steroidobacter agaridevorans]|uniref:DUF748 domain-containing protein n=2 Tax=Steroidobacter agaridevorans TaxID=2695856 RepID=A0A829YAD5_9GAMM|nr:hypothetical protein GCM10011487_19530 [Steroidobacter agaridevorans]
MPAMSTVKRFAAPLVALIRLHLVAILVVAALLLVYTLFGFFAVPRIARAQLQSYVTEQMHRQVSVGEIRFNPFAFDASVAGLALREADGSPVVGFRHLYVNAELASMWQRAVVLKEVELSAPDIDVIVAKDGTVNLAKLAPESEEASTEEQTALPRVRIDRLDIRDGRIGFTDNTHTQPFTAVVAPIKFTLTDFKTDANYENAYDFSGATLAGERLEWVGAFTVQPLGSNGRFRVQDLKAATIDAYAKDMLPFQLASGIATLAGDYRFAMTPSLGFEATLPLLQVRDLSVKERQAKSAPVKLPEVDIHEIALSYEKQDLGMKRIDVKGAHIDVALEPDGSISLMRLFGEESKESRPVATPAASSAASVGDSAPEDAQGESDEWRVHAETIQLSDATVVAEDRSVKPVAKFDLAPIALTVNGWSTDASAKVQVDADVTIDKQGKLLGKGDVQLEPLGAQLAVELKDFELPAIQPYLNEATAMTLHSGRLGAKGDVSYVAQPESAPPLKFKGEVRVADLRTTDELVNEDFVKWRSLTVTGIDFSMNPDKLDINRIVARQPYGKVVIAKDTTLNVTKVLSPAAPTQQSEQQETTEKEDDAGDTKQAAAGKQGDGSDIEQDKGGAKPTPAPSATASEPMFPIRIKSVQLIDGSANFADYSIEPSFATGILELNGTVTGLSSDPSSRAKVKLDGKVDKYAPVDIGGEVNLLSAAVYTDLSMNFRNMELTTFNPYSGKFAGYNISKGKLSTELKYLVQDRTLDASHHIVIDNLEFGDKTDSKDAAPIPLKLAVALLKDRQGIIDLNLPVSGTLDDPKFRLGPIIWKAVLNLLTKIVTAPFAALGALIGGGEEMQFVDFDAGKAELPVTQTEKLNKLAKALVERPQLKLSVPLTVVTAQDSEAIARTALKEKLPPNTSAEPPKDDAAKRQRIALLEKVYKEVARSAPAYPPETETEKGIDFDARLKFLDQSLLDRFKPDDAALTALAQQRARAVQDTLLANTELSPERVFITAERSEGKAEAKQVRMELKLE